MSLPESATFAHEAHALGESIPIKVGRRLHMSIPAGAFTEARALHAHKGKVSAYFLPRVFNALYGTGIRTRKRGVGVGTDKGLRGPR